MFSKSQKPDNLLGIHLDLPRMGRSSIEYFTSGDSVCGAVTLDTPNNSPIGTITVRFFGCSKSYLNRAGANGSVWVKAQPWLFLQEKKYNVDRLLEPGKHNWHFHFRFPHETDPDVNEEAYEETEKFRAGKHPLPPSMDIRTSEYSVQTEAVVWYGLDVVMTQPGETTESDPTTLLLTYTPLRADKYPSIEPSTSASLTKTFSCRSTALLPGRESKVTQKLSLSDKTHSFFHRDSTPTATFSLALHLAESYAINEPLPIYLVLTHNPDNKSTLPPGASPPDLALTKLTITLNAWSNVRGTSKWNGSEDTTENKSHTLVAMPNETFTFTPPILSSAKGEPNDLAELAAHAAGMHALVWPEEASLPPSFATYNLLVAYTLSVEVEVMCAGKKFELEFNRNLRKQEGVFTLLPGYAETLARPENVVGRRKEGYEYSGWGRKVDAREERDEKARISDVKGIEWGIKELKV